MDLKGGKVLWFKKKISNIYKTYETLLHLMHISFDVKIIAE